MALTTDRSENLLALLLLQQLKAASTGEKAEHLSLAGFSNSEIADLLQTKAAVVSQLLYMRRQSGAKSKKKKK